MTLKLYESETQTYIDLPEISHIIGEVILEEKYKFIDAKIIVSIVHDTIRALKEEMIKTLAGGEGRK